MLSAVCALLATLHASSRWFSTLKIVIQGPDLTAPIQITDEKAVANFQVLAGKGTYANEPRLEEPSFIIDWSRGPTIAPSKDLPHYEILFYGDRPNEHLVYTVSYAFDALNGNGYVYLPGRKDPGYELNVHTIIRRVEGHWFHSWDKWDRIAQRLIRSRVREQFQQLSPRVETGRPSKTGVGEISARELVRKLKNPPCPQSDRQGRVL